MVHVPRERHHDLLVGQSNYNSRPQSYRTPKSDRQVLGRIHTKTDVLAPWEVYNSYDDVSIDSCGYMIKAAILV